jgi:hypothetical protein
MKIFFLTPLFFVISLSADKCENKKDITAYKGRLEVKGICMNYTIKLLEGKLDESKIEKEWKDEVSGKIHNNVFALESVCDFPSTIKEGDEFYFTIDTTSKQQCAVCLAFYPKPAKSLAIKVVTK